jgi:hypothetical protein
MDPVPAKALRENNFDELALSLRSDLAGPIEQKFSRKMRFASRRADRNFCKMRKMLRLGVGKND